MLTTLITIVVIIVVVGAVVWLLQQAPIDPNIKQWGVWLLYAVGLVLILTRLLPLLGVST